nr:protein FAR1-RELATED SEQUENCE 5-like [Ipomoea batatas]
MDYASGGCDEGYSTDIGVEGSACDMEISPGMTKYWRPNCAEILKPHVGQQFVSLDTAFGFYKQYAGSVGFDCRQSTTRKGRDGGVVLKQVVCSREGFKKSSSSTSSTTQSNVVKRRKRRSREKEEGSRRSTPLVRQTDSVSAAARRRELAAAPREEVAGHCPTPQDLLASSTNQYCSLDIDHQPCFARFWHRICQSVYSTLSVSDGAIKVQITQHWFPTFHHSGDLNSQSGVYAFGVVLLEVLTGRPTLDRRLVEEHYNLATWAIDYMRKGNVDDIVIIIVTVCIGVKVRTSGNPEDLPMWFALVVVIFMCTYVAGFAWSWGPLGWLMRSEIFPPDIRSVAQSINVSLNMIFTFAQISPFLHCTHDLVNCIEEFWVTPKCVFLLIAVGAFSTSLATFNSPVAIVRVLLVFTCNPSGKGASSSCGCWCCGGCAGCGTSGTGIDGFPSSGGAGASSSLKAVSTCPYPNPPDFISSRSLLDSSLNVQFLMAGKLLGTMRLKSTTRPRTAVTSSAVIWIVCPFWSFNVQLRGSKFSTNHSPIWRGKLVICRSRRLPNPMSFTAWRCAGFSCSTAVHLFPLDCQPPLLGQVVLLQYALVGAVVPLQCVVPLVALVRAL